VREQFLIVVVAGDDEVDPVFLEERPRGGMFW
jgi:hypothetical protein